MVIESEVAVVIVACAAAAFLWSTVRTARLRRGVPLSRVRLLAAGAAGFFVVGVVLAVVSWLLPDVLDDLPDGERADIGPALAASRECGVLPFARVMELEVRQTGSGEVVLRYGCAVGPIGYPRFRGEAHCDGLNWSAFGMKFPWWAGNCSGFVADGAP